MEENKKQLWQAVKFTLFSVSAGVIQIGSFALLEIFIKDYWIPYLISLVLSILWNFTLNRKFTFSSAANIPKAMLLVALFYAVFTPATTYLTFLLTDASVGFMWPSVLVEGLMMLINFVTEYLYQRYVVFRNSIDTAIN